MKKYKKNKNDKEYIPRNPEKYCGRYPIILKSTWETKFAQWLDYNRDVIEWSSESIKIPYIDPTKGRNYGVLDERMGKRRIYYPDFYCKMKNGDKYIVEIKPSKYIRQVKNKGRKSNKTMLMRKEIYLINQAKFESAKRYCKKLGYEFLIITENELFRK